MTRELTINEVEEVSGGLMMIGAICGAAFGGISYWAGSSSPNFEGLAVAMGTGAIGGAIGTPFIGGGFATFGGLYANEIK